MNASVLSAGNLVKYLSLVGSSDPSLRYILGVAGNVSAHASYLRYIIYIVVFHNINDKLILSVLLLLCPLAAMPRGSTLRLVEAIELASSILQ